jgi:hypothetical protein
MPVKVEITDADIDYAERILLPAGSVFDTERREFIKNLDTIDLQAVPGSGKTTALLAKLLILDRKLPFVDGSGILVISHTNVAVDEIKSRIGKHCNKLFNYPNYVGTIQSFVDKFLCIPHFCNVNGKRPNRIDNEICDEYISQFLANTKNYNLKGWLERKNDPAQFLRSLRVNEQGNLVIGTNGTEAEFPLKDKSTPTYQGLLRFATSFGNSGFIQFEDAYNLGNRYIEINPKVKKYCNGDSDMFLSMKCRIWLNINILYLKAYFMKKAIPHPHTNASAIRTKPYLTGTVFLISG